MIAVQINWDFYITALVSRTLQKVLSLTKAAELPVKEHKGEEQQRKLF